MKVFTNILSTVLFISAAQISSAATELGEFCFAGAFQNTGDCIISIEATQHGKYISLNGLSQCEVNAGKVLLADDYNGIVHGNGYIDDKAIYHGALDVFTSSDSDMTTKSMLFEINLKTEKVIFKDTGGRSICNPSRNCDSSIEFDIVACP